MNDDLLPGHADIDAALASARQEHVRHLAAVLDLDSGLAAILTPDAVAGRGEPAATDPAWSIKDKLVAFRQDPQVTRLALKWAGDPDQAEEALQTTYCAIARMRHPERIHDLRGYFLRALKNEAAGLHELRQSMPIEDPESVPGPVRPVDETVTTTLLVRTWLERFAAQRDCLLAAVPARSDDPDRYRAMIHAAAEQVLRDAINREPSDADTNAALRAAYPEYFDRPGATPSTLHQRFRRARADVRALLSTVVSRDELT